MSDQPVMNYRPLAGQLVRQALDVTRDPANAHRGMLELGRVINRRMSGQHHRERTRFEGTLAMAAADFAAQLTEEQRKQVFARLDASDEALWLRGLLLAVAVDLSNPHEKVS